VEKEIVVLKNIAEGKNDDRKKCEESCAKKGIFSPRGATSRQLVKKGFAFWIQKGWRSTGKKRRWGKADPGRRTGPTSESRETSVKEARRNRKRKWSSAEARRNKTLKKGEASDTGACKRQRLAKTKTREECRTKRG